MQGVMENCNTGVPIEAHLLLFLLFFFLPPQAPKFSTLMIIYVT